MLSFNFLALSALQFNSLIWISFCVNCSVNFLTSLSNLVALAANSLVLAKAALYLASSSWSSFSLASPTVLSFLKDFTSFSRASFWRITSFKLSMISSSPLPSASSSSPSGSTSVASSSELTSSSSSSTLFSLSPSTGSQLTPIFTFPDSSSISTSSIDASYSWPSISTFLISISASGSTSVSVSWTSPTVTFSSETSSVSSSSSSEPSSTGISSSVPSSNNTSSPVISSAQGISSRLVEVPPGRISSFKEIFRESSR